MEKNDFNYGIKVKLKTPDDFLKIKETLSRIGISSRRENKLFQSCHILHKRGEYYICHFKEMFQIDGKESDISEEDIKRRNAITWLLAEWNLLTVDPEFSKTKEDRLSISQIKIIPFKEKGNWELVQKYTMGVKKSFNKN